MQSRVLSPTQFEKEIKLLTIYVQRENVIDDLFSSAISILSFQKLNSHLLSRLSFVEIVDKYKRFGLTQAEYKINSLTQYVIYSLKNNISELKHFTSDWPHVSTIRSSPHSSTCNPISTITQITTDKNMRFIIDSDADVGDRLLMHFMKYQNSTIYIGISNEDNKLMAKIAALRLFFCGVRYGEIINLSDSNHFKMSYKIDIFSPRFSHNLDYNKSWLNLLPSSQQIELLQQKVYKIK